MGKKYIKEENGKKVLYEENTLLFGDKKLGELHENLDGSLETRNAFGENYKASEKGGFLDVIGDLIPGAKPHDYEVETSSGKFGTFEWNRSRDRYEFKEKAIEGKVSKFVSTIDGRGQNESVSGQASISNYDHWSGRVKKKREDFKKMSVLGWLYFGVCIFLTLLWAYLSFKIYGGDPAKAADGVINSIWSPTNDPVLNFLINAVIVIVGLAIAPGILVVIFCFAIVIFAIWAIVIIIQLLK
ncbi:MAG: hypothetical protein M0Z70_06615 [Nitrospiraceae bacterium]|nr:hypothetical protein [Nitrospirota bacterium]MDA8338953.1 hypothetical protein [Nitrospiraceae bacterium]